MGPGSLRCWKSNGQVVTHASPGFVGVVRRSDTQEPCRNLRCRAKRHVALSFSGQDFCVCRGFRSCLNADEPSQATFIPSFGRLRYIPKYNIKLNFNDFSHSTGREDSGGGARRQQCLHQARKRSRQARRALCDGDNSLQLPRAAAAGAHHAASTFLTVANSTSLSIGLTRKSDTPMSVIFNMNLILCSAVSTMTLSFFEVFVAAEQLEEFIARHVGHVDVQQQQSGGVAISILPLRPRLRRCAPGNPRR